MNVRKIKKIMKKSNGSFSMLVDNMIFNPLEWGALKYHKKGISIDNAEYIPYNIIKKVMHY